MQEPIPFNKIFRSGGEQQAVASVLESDCWHGDGPAGQRVESMLGSWLKSRHVYLTTSCTHALEMAMMVLGIGKGDEVIMPSFTFVSTANAVRMQGAEPVFAEIRESDLTLDPVDVSRKMTSSTRAVIPIHYAGVSADFDALYEKIGGHGISVVEDAAQAVGAYWKGRALGTVGDVGCFSFHDTKNITCGEGGAFLTQRDDLAEKAEWVREKGTNRTAFLRGEIDRYTWISPGSSYIPSELLAAVLEAQLQKKEEILLSRKTVWESYHEQLGEAYEKGWIRLPVVPEYARSNYHIFHFNVTEEKRRDSLLKSLREAGIGATFHYIPLHDSPYAVTHLGRRDRLPVTERLAASLVRLPLYPDLLPRKEEVAGRVRDVIHRFFKHGSTGGAHCR